eukprot:2337087-Alexandrium_andersonii.AAC.1
MAAPLAGGGWSQRPMTSTEGGLWLREILSKHGVDPVELANVGSHSLKCTLLSWAAKAGMRPSERRVLGYHSKPGDRSVLELSLIHI